MSFNSKVCLDPTHDDGPILLTISLDNKHYAIWCTIDQFLRVLSSYFYAEVATLGSAQPGEVDFIIMVMFEAFFFISCFLKFFE